MRPRSPTSPCSKRPSPSRQTTPADQGPSPRSRSIRRTTASVGRPWSRSSSRLRQSRTTVAPRRSCSPSRRSATGETAASVEVCGGSHRSVAATVPSLSRLCSARMTRRSSLRAVFESMSCPQTARSRAWATVAVRTGRRPRRCFAARPSRGSPATSPRNSEWSSSSAKTQRSFSAASADSDRIVTVPSGDCHAWATAPQQRAVMTPSCTRRVASPDEPRGERERVRTARADDDFGHVPSLLPRLDTAARASCDGRDRCLPSPRCRGL